MKGQKGDAQGQLRFLTVERRPFFFVGIRRLRVFVLLLLYFLEVDIVEIFFVPKHFCAAGTREIDEGGVGGVEEEEGIRSHVTLCTDTRV